MNSETKSCQSCGQKFPILSDDTNFYDRLNVPPPTFCPDCRLIRRLVLRNERALYKRKCDSCGETKILMFDAESPYTVYCYECWWSDKWTALDHGVEYDFKKPFFEQFSELLHKVPRPGIIKQGNHIESEYTNRVTDMRHCYLIYGTAVAEYCRYGVWFNDSKECMDGYNVQKSERCYECIDCYQCYGLAFSQECDNCTDSWFLTNCTNCQNCFGCVNLRNKSYCIFNKQYTKEEYEKIISGYALESAVFVEAMKAKFEEFKKKFIVPALVTHHSTNVSGNWIEDSKNIYAGFNCLNIEEGRYLFSVLDGKDVMDYSNWGKPAERIYEVISSGIQISDLRFGNECWNQARDMDYVMNCHSSHDLFGCVGIRNLEYCILNKQYSKDEYEKLVSKIKEQMKEMPYKDKKGRVYEYGEMFPIEISPFAYNETLAQEFFPIDQKKAEEMGFPWKEPEKKDYKITLDAMALPDALSGVEDSITGEVIGCEHEGKCNQQCATAFRITTEDLERHRNAKIPLPRLCPNCRHFERLEKRNPIKLWPRKCQCAGIASDNELYTNEAKGHKPHSDSEHCPNEFETSYDPERKEIVYCIDCYRAEIA